MGKTSPVTNSFAVDYQQGNGVIDLNNPPKKPYVYQEYPKMLYAASGKYLVVQNEAEERRYAKHGYSPNVPEKKSE